ncbi:conserved hypothetical protein (putative transposase or invertase) [Flexibacter flexilis DSM 6793]|uniref:Transposase n=1 Tax=Flexibacter flexilis DSM 6793 TaxID=927664 RepID=A0A1I1KV60_9BACT|nr:hypothetical protein [Flexibacter flexilis]SFC64694.1 conserved hypothetical protein (putative transposase or invertase) [Flexibacter flexilis DSM 6793]
MKAKYINPYTEIFKTETELANLGQTELDKYESSLKVYRDLKGVIDTAFDEGKLEGKLEGIQESKLAIAQNLLKSPLSDEEIASYTGLTTQQIQQLRAQIN